MPNFPAGKQFKDAIIKDPKLMKLYQDSEKQADTDSKASPSVIKVRAEKKLTEIADKILKSLNATYKPQNDASKKEAGKKLFTLIHNNYPNIEDKLTEIITNLFQKFPGDASGVFGASFLEGFNSAQANAYKTTKDTKANQTAAATSTATAVSSTAASAVASQRVDAKDSKLDSKHTVSHTAVTDIKTTDIKNDDFFAADSAASLASERNEGKMVNASKKPPEVEDSTFNGAVAVIQQKLNEYSKIITDLADAGLKEKGTDLDNKLSLIKDQAKELADKQSNLDYQNLGISFNNAEAQAAVHKKYLTSEVGKLIEEINDVMIEDKNEKNRVTFAELVSKVWSKLSTILIENGDRLFKFEQDTERRKGGGDPNKLLSQSDLETRMNERILLKHDLLELCKEQEEILTKFIEQFNKIAEKNDPIKKIAAEIAERVEQARTAVENARNRISELARPNQVQQESDANKKKNAPIAANEYGLNLIPNAAAKTPSQSASAAANTATKDRKQTAAHTAVNKAPIPSAASTSNMDNKHTTTKKFGGH